MSENIETPKKSNGAFITIILILLIGLALMAYKSSTKNTELNACNNKTKEMLADLEAMNQMMVDMGFDVDGMSNDLTKDFTAMLKTYDELIEKDASKADSLNIQKEKILGLMQDLENSKKNGRLNARKIAQMTRENNTLRTIMRGYVVQIDSLNTLNVKLTSDLDQTTTKLNSTETERDAYKSEAEVSKEKVKIGQKLQAYGMSTVGLRMKLNNTTEETNKAKQCVQIRSSFTVSENSLANAGTKTVYMQIIDPDGKTLQSRSSNSVQTDAGSIAYSDKKDIDYQNQQIDMSIFFDLQSKEALKGNYKVKIYCDGTLIGTDSFSLK
jgi:hypothetical protein